MDSPAPGCPTTRSEPLGIIRLIVGGVLPLLAATALLMSGRCAARAETEVCGFTWSPGGIRYDYSLLRNPAPERVSAADSEQHDTKVFGGKTGLKKLPQITVLFWVMKIAATTLGETGGDLSPRP